MQSQQAYRIREQALAAYVVFLLLEMAELSQRLSAISRTSSDNLRPRSDSGRIISRVWDTTVCLLGHQTSNAPPEIAPYSSSAFPRICIH